VVVGQVRRLLTRSDAGQFALFYTLVTQTTGVRIRKLIEQEIEKRAAKVGQE